MPTIPLEIGTEGAKRSLQELQAVADQLESKLKSIAGSLGGGNATTADSAAFFSTASQLSGVRAQMAASISGSATASGGGGPFSGSDNPFAAPQFKMQKLGDVQAAANFVLNSGVSGPAREARMSQVLSGAVPMATGGTGISAPPRPEYAYGPAYDGNPDLERFRAIQAGKYNALNPFSGNEPTGMSMPLLPNGVQRLQFDWENQQRNAQQMRLFAGAAGYEAAHFAGQIAGAYTQSVTSGQPQTMAYGAAYGGAGGFAGGAGIGAAIGSIVPGIGTFIGAGVGGLIGGTLGSQGVNAIQAPYVARAATELSLAPMAAQNGMDAGVLTDNAQAIATRYNNSKMPGPGLERGFRNLGVYAGNDQASEQDAAAIMAALSGGYLQSGVDPNGQDISGQTAALIRSAGGGKPASALATAIGRAQAATASTGGNAFALMEKIGVPDFLIYNKDHPMISRADEQAFIRAHGDLATAGRNTGISASYGDIGRSDYDSSAFGGRSTRQRDSGFQSMIGAMRGQIGSLNSEISVMQNAPGGGDPALIATKKALVAAATAQIQQEYGKRAQGIVGDIEAGSAVNIANANATLSRANLYGSADEFAAPTNALRSALASEASGLTASLHEKGLTYEVSMQKRARIAEIGQQMAALPAMQAAQEFGRRNLIGDVRAAESGVVSTRANLYGDNSALEAAGGGMIAAQQRIMQDAFLTMNNPSASIETRSAAEMRAAGAQNSILQVQAGTRGAVINRIQQSSSANQAELGVNLATAQYGSGADMRMAGAGLVAAFGVEEGRLTEQINAPGTTVEQKLALRSQIAGLQTSAINLTEQTRDAGFQKDFISGYGLEATKLAGQAARQELLPFNPGNIMRTGLQIVQNNQKGLSLLAAREAELKKAGTYSPERQLEIETQRQNLLTQDDAQIANLANDLPNRLPGMAAGRPAFAARFNSFDLASMAVAGTGIRSFGAHGGGQIKEQDDFLHDLTTPGGIAARSRTQAMNNGGQEIALLERIAAALEKNGGSGGSGMRPGEGTGAIASAVYGKRANLDNGRQY